MKHLFALVVWLLPCTLCSYTFRGTVVSEDGRGLEFTNIAVSNSADSTFFTGVVTDSVGHFEFDLPAGSYMVRFMRLGYAAETFCMLKKRTSLRSPLFCVVRNMSDSEFFLDCFDFFISFAVGIIIVGRTLHLSVNFDVELYFRLCT